jgi:hypothetical protein
MDLRFAGADAVAAAKARASGSTDRGPINRALVNENNNNAAKLALDVNFKNIPSGVKTSTDAEGDAFSNVTVRKTPSQTVGAHFN